MIIAIILFLVTQSPNCRFEEDYSVSRIACDASGRVYHHTRDGHDTRLWCEQKSETKKGGKNGGVADREVTARWSEPSDPSIKQVEP